MAGTGGQSHRRFWEFVFVAVLVLYPLRHIAWGLDLWDTGYGYANFVCISLLGYKVLKIPAGLTFLGDLFALRDLFIIM